MSDPRLRLRIEHEWQDDVPSWVVYFLPPRAREWEELRRYPYTPALDYSGEDEQALAAEFVAGALAVLEREASTR